MKADRELASSVKDSSEENGIQVRSRPGASVSEVQDVLSNSTLLLPLRVTRGDRNRQHSLGTLGNNSKDGSVSLLWDFARKFGLLDRALSSQTKRIPLKC